MVFRMISKTSNCELSCELTFRSHPAYSKGSGQKKEENCRLLTENSLLVESEGIEPSSKQAITTAFYTLSFCLDFREVTGQKLPTRPLF